jgi:hypothetical protein
MTRIAGIKADIDSKGKLKSIWVDVKKHPEVAEFIEDYMDALEAKQIRAEGDFVPWDEVKKELDRHHGIKRK